MAANACQRCDGLRRNRSVWDGSPKRYEVSLPDLLKNRDPDCKGCELLATAFRHVKPEIISDERRFDPAFDLPDGDVKIKWSSPGPKEEMQLLVEYAHERIISGGRKIKVNCGKIYEIFARPDAKRPLDSISSDVAYFRQPDEASGFRLLSRWLRDCEQLHQECNTSNAPLPKRILDIRITLSPDLVRLYESRGEKEPYIALSHCWGSPERHTMPVQTLKNNLDARKRAIVITSLGKTFQDAITLCRSLGIAYLWVDSLCIVQNDELDWEEQAAQMGSIYTNAWLTINAANAESGADGCFFHRRETDARELQSGVLIRQFNKRCLSFDTPPHLLRLLVEEDERVLKSTFSRGWCLQERLLSRRIIHYTSKEMIWECNTSARCECGQTSRASLRHHFQVYPDWMEIVEHYTGAGLTYPSDLLPALSGIASTFKARTNSHYLAGIWENDAIRLLSWRRKRPSQRASEYTAPSFSWASALGDAVFSRYMHLRFHAHFLEGRCKLQSANPFGRVSDGYVKLRGCLLPARGFLMVRPDSTYHLTIKVGKDYVLPLIPDFEEDWADSGVPSLYCLPLFSHTDPSQRDTAACKQNDLDGLYHLTALVLQKDMQERFRRVGLTHSHGGDLFGEEVEALLSFGPDVPDTDIAIY